MQTFTDWKTGFSRKGVNTFEQDEDFSFVEKSFFFFISYCSSEATEDTNIFPRRQNKCNFYTDLQYLEVFTPLLPLYTMCFLLDHQWTFETCVIVVEVPQFSSVCKDGTQKSNSHCWKGFKYAKDARNTKNLVLVFWTNKQTHTHTSHI